MKKLILIAFLAASLPQTSLAAGLLSLSQSNVALNMGSSVSITAYPAGNQGIYVSSVTNTFVAYANVSDSSITIYGLGAGNTQITFCTYDNSCGTIYVTVGGAGSNPNLGQITFSQNSVSLNQYQNQSVIIFGSISGYYVSNNSNPNIVSTSLSGSSLNLYGQNSGSSTITVCATNSGQCASLFVTVNPITSIGSLYFLTTNLIQPIINQYYSSQLSVTGGTAPYTFTLASGALRPGLYLSANGQIYGTMTTNASSTFMVRATDAYGRTATSGLFSLQPTGSVLGSTIYANGSLINDNGTIYITYKNTKSGFANMNAFSGLGYSLKNVTLGSTASLAQSGLVIANSSMAHPWGSWIKNGTTIYFVHDQGLIPIASYPVFLNNGGRDALVVNANLDDMYKPVQYLMDNNDSRLR